MLLYFRNDREEWKNDKRKLKEKYELTELGQVKQILGMRVTKLNNNSLMLDQGVYVNDKLSHIGTNSFTLLLENNIWKIVHIIDTRRKK